MGANVPVEASIIDAEVLEDGCHRDVLVVRALNVGQETASRTRDFGQELEDIVPQRN